MSRKTRNPDKRRSQFSIVLHRMTRNKGAMVGLAVIVILLLLVLFGKYVTPYEHYHMDYMQMFQSPNSVHIFGTDGFGRDIFSRILYGARFSLIVSVGSVLLAALLGSTLGILAGYYGGMADTLLMRFLDVYQSIPGLVLVLALSTVLGRGVFNTMIALGVTGMAGYARLIRGAVLQVKGSEFIEASRSVKGSDFFIITRHVLPNSISPVIVSMTMGIGSNIIAIASLGFVGMGVPTSVPEWGAMLSEARAYLGIYPHMMLAPGIAIILTVLGFNLFGDGLRDAMDPRLKD